MDRFGGLVWAASDWAMALGLHRQVSGEVRHVTILWGTSLERVQSRPWSRLDGFVGVSLVLSTGEDIRNRRLPCGEGEIPRYMQFRRKGAIRLPLFNPIPGCVDQPLTVSITNSEGFNLTIATR